mgnify:CR=1 FL=1
MLMQQRYIFCTTHIYAYLSINNRILNNGRANAYIILLQSGIILSVSYVLNFRNHL